MDVRYAVHPDAVQQSTIEALHKEFCIRPVFEKDRVNLTLSDQDRMLVGGVMPLETLDLAEAVPPPAVVSLENREMGIINIGGPGRVETDSGAYDLMPRDALYIGKGNGKFLFSSADAGLPAKFYCNSAPAHASYPTVAVRGHEMEPELRGSPENANLRKMYRYITPGRVATCQLEMGLTALEPGSVWCSMPPHIHRHRMEVYFYFDLPEEHILLHFMGRPGCTRHLTLKTEQAVISPGWSVHSGVGTHSYAFIWGMCGEHSNAGKAEILSFADL